MQRACAENQHTNTSAVVIKPVQQRQSEETEVTFKKLRGFLFAVHSVTIRNTPNDGLYNFTLTVIADGLLCETALIPDN